MIAQFSKMLLLTLFLVFFAVLIECKHISGQVTFVSGKVNNLGKFSFRPAGDSVITGTFSFRGEPRGSIYLFMDTEWENYHTSSDDCARMAFATARIPIAKDPVLYGKGWTENTNLNTVNENQESYVFSFTWKITHHVRTYGYYLATADCESTPQRKFKVAEYKIDFFNDDTDHFPADEHGLFTLYLICFSILTGFAVKKLNERKSKSGFSFSNGPPTAANTLLFIAYMFEATSILFEILHLWWYGYNGKGIFLLDFFSEVLEGIAQTAIAYLLLAFACGWTIIDGAIPSDGAINPEALGEDHPSTLFVALMTVVTVLLQILSKLILFDDLTKFHDYETWPGLANVFVRTLLAIFFTYQIRETISYMQKRSSRGSQALKFMKSLAVLGGLWFWVFPFLVALASVFAHYLRHRLVAGGVVLLQSICLILVTKQVTSESSTYSKASLHAGVVLGDSFHRRD